MGNIDIIINPTAQSGHAENIWQTVKAILDEQETKYQAYFTEYYGHAKELANQISKKEGIQNIVVVGGDGTINEILCGIEDFSTVRLGVIPAGSGNDFANGIKVNGCIENCLERILDTIDIENAKLPKMDLGKVSWNKKEDYRIFGISSGIGLDALVSKKALDSKLKTFLNIFGLGKLTYVILTIVTLLTMKKVNGRISFDDERGTVYHKLIFAAAMNLKSEGGGVPMAPNATATNRTLTICLAHGIHRIPAFGMLVLLMMEKHIGLKGVEVKEFQKCRIQMKEPMVVHADGEYCGTFSDVEFECLAGVLPILGIPNWNSESGM